MKKIYFLCLAMIISFSIIAQKNVNVDSYRFVYQERSVPSKQVNPRSFYYTTKIVMPGTVKNAVDEESLYNSLKIQGQRYTDQPSENDLLVTLTMEGLNIKSNEVHTRTVETKDKNGNVTRVNYYSVWVIYNFQSDIDVKQGDDVVVKYNLYNRSTDLKYLSDEFSTSSAAADYWRNNRDNLKEGFIREVVSNSVSTSSNALSSAIGFRVTKEGDMIKTIKDKKHPENDALREKADALKNRLEKLDGTNPMKEEEIADIIEYFKALPGRYTDPKLKADVKLRYVAYYNLGKIYLFLDQPENVFEYAKLLIENEHDKKDGEKLIKEATNLQERFSKTDIKTRQFDPDKFFAD